MPSELLEIGKMMKTQSCDVLHNVSTRVTFPLESQLTAEQGRNTLRPVQMYYF